VWKWGFNIGRNGWGSEAEQRWYRPNYDKAGEEQEGWGGAAKIMRPRRKRLHSCRMSSTILLLVIGVVPVLKRD